MKLFWIILIIPFVSGSSKDIIQLNYPYYNFDKFLSYLMPNIRTREENFNSDGSYYFKYDTGFGEQQSFRGETRDRKGVIRGYYGYIDPDGVLRITRYISDHMGYRARTTSRYSVLRKFMGQALNQNP